MYKITFNMYSPICFIDKPIFDSILARCFVIEKRGFLTQKLNLSKNELIDFSELPIKKHSDGYHLASIMFYDESIEFLGSWKKRWNNKHDFLVDFCGKPRKISVQKGEYKSYDVPKLLHSIPVCWFYFESDQPEMVHELIEKHLVGIGKKVSQGDGWFKNFEIEETTEKSFAKELLRPIPESKTKMRGIKKYCGWKIPFWLPKNMELCQYPETDLKG